MYLLLRGRYSTSIWARRTACRLVYHSSRGRCRMRRIRSPRGPYSGCVVQCMLPVAREHRNVSRNVRPWSTECCTLNTGRVPRTASSRVCCTSSRELQESSPLRQRLVVPSATGTCSTRHWHRLGHGSTHRFSLRSCSANAESSKPAAASAWLRWFYACHAVLRQHNEGEV